MSQIQDNIVDQLIARGIDIDVSAPDVAPMTGLISIRGNISMMNGEETIVRHPFDPPFAAIAKGLIDTAGDPVFAFGYTGPAALYALETRLATMMRDGNVLRSTQDGAQEWLTLDRSGRVCTFQEYWAREATVPVQAPTPSL